MNSANEDIILSREFSAERKHFFVEFRENDRGKFLRITEEDTQEAIAAGLPPWVLNTTAVHFLSPDGAPLKFRIALPKAERKRQVFLRVHGADGKEVFRKTLEQEEGNEGSAFDLEVPVPASGNYSVAVHGLRHASFVPASGQHLFTHNPWVLLSGRLHFYVPRDVEEIHGYASADNVLIAPDGTRITIEPDETRTFRVPVAEGDRGKVWRVGARAPLAFFNLPNIFFYDPSKVIVPDEIEM